MQAELTAAIGRRWGEEAVRAERLSSLHRNARVLARHLALPIEECMGLGSFTSKNRAFVTHGLRLGEIALTRALERAGRSAVDVDHLLTVTTTGVATPSIDALLMNRLPLRGDLVRSPLFGLGCAAGAAGVARAADWLRARPEGVVALLSVELCSLTAQWDDTSIVNLVASGLFGDGAAACVLEGAGRGGEGPTVVDARASFYPDTEGVMGWDVGSHGFRLVLSADVPAVVRERVAPDVDAFLADHGLGREDVGRWVLHPGGPKVLDALRDALGLSDEATQPARRNLERVGNLSSASVLFDLETALAAPPPPGTWGVLLAMGPAFASEMVLLRW